MNRSLEIMRRSAYLLFILLGTFRSHAATSISAASASLTDFNSAVAAAAAGDTIVLPAGDTTWTSAVTVSKPIHIQGAGVGKTIIRHTGNALLVWAGNVTASVDGIEFHLSYTSNSADILYLRGRNNRISNCRFVGDTSKVCGVRTAGGTSNPHPTGVVWNCSFYSARALVQGDIASSSTQLFGRRIWSDLDDTVAFGTAGNMFFEDCTFDLTTNTGNVIDAEYGGHYVFRHNTVINGGAFAHGITGNSERGTRLVEIYDNQFRTVPGITPQDAAIRLRGGTGVVYNNTISGTWNAAMTLDGELQRYGNDIADGNLAVASGTGSHNGSPGTAILTDSTKSWTPGAFVGWTVYNSTDGSFGTITANTANTVTASLANGSQNSWSIGDSYKITNGYPLRDQIGRGKDAAFWISGAAGPSQTLEPVYEWNNSYNGSDANFGVVPGYLTWIQIGRDYFQNTPRPNYVAFTYPHPLRDSNPLAASLPAPSNVRVNSN